MREATREHGYLWERRGRVCLGQILIYPKGDLTKKYPYLVWVTVGKDIEIEHE